VIIYIAGKMTGDPGYPFKFARAAELLKASGHIVLNPANNPIGMSREAYMQIDIAMMGQADAVYFLSDWRDSPGAQLEWHY